MAVTHCPAHVKCASEAVGAVKRHKYHGHGRRASCLSSDVVGIGEPMRTCHPSGSKREANSLSSESPSPGSREPPESPRYPAPLIECTLRKGSSASDVPTAG